MKPAMKAIKTTYHGPTDTRSSRVKTTEPDGKSVTLPWDHSLNAECGESVDCDAEAA